MGIEDLDWRKEEIKQQRQAKKLAPIRHKNAIINIMLNWLY